MRCPFCLESVDDEAVVCKACRRDISIPKPLMEAKRALEAKVETLEVENAELKRRMARNTASAGAILQRFVFNAAIYILPPIALFVVARYLLLFKFDADLVWLRVVTTVTSIIAGYLFQDREQPHWLVTVCSAAAIAVGSVLAMGLGDYAARGASILPSNDVERLQSIEFVGNIAFAFVLGALLAIGMRPVRLSGDTLAAGFVGFLAIVIARNLPARKEKPLHQRVRHLERVIAFSVSVLAFSGSLYSGFSRFLK